MNQVDHRVYRRDALDFYLNSEEEPTLLETHPPKSREFGLALSSILGFAILLWLALTGFRGKNQPQLQPNRNQAPAGLR